MEECLNHYQNEKERTVFIIGGGEIYKMAMESGIIEEMYITHVDETLEADTYFPEFDFNKWATTKLLHQEKDGKNPYGFEVVRYVRK